MARPIKIKINVTKLLKEHFFKANSGAIYVDLVAWENRTPGRYGDTHYVVQDIKKDKLPEGTKAPIVGNLTLPNDSPAQSSRSATSEDDMDW